MKCQPKCQKCEQNMFCALFKYSNNTTLSKNVILLWFCFLQVVQKHTLGDVKH